MLMPQKMRKIFKALANRPPPEMKVCFNLDESMSLIIWETAKQPHKKAKKGKRNVQVEI
jgi:hypothetical protein